MSLPILKTITVTSKFFAENAYIAYLEGAKDCLIFDPGFNPDWILEAIRHHGLIPAAILNTHGHADHIAGNAALKKAYPSCPLVIGEGDAPKLTDPMLNLSGGYGVKLVSPPADRLVKHGEIFAAAGISLEIREAPGHCCGHVVFVWSAGSPQIVFGGDVLFEGSVGRTDFPDGDSAQLLKSIREQLFTLPDDSIVLPGHGDPTTIGHEKRTNPYVSRGGY